MIRDPRPAWDGRYPYEALEPAGIGPHSTQEEVENASFTLMTSGLMNAATQAAWDELREVPKRLLADALLYDVDLPAAVAEARARLERERAEAAAPPPVPPQRETALELLASIGDDLPPVEARPAPPVDVSAELAAFPPRHLLDTLIRFDQ
ncbi:hypothetical protein [Glycomyces terrestris]|uniref:hypothetical protein n=1 Tax=Glycomyces terrestris TaxID=2493553 RepID=UPI0013158D10|nr:hypothetical protein [Glycomyces terrestris]